MKSFAVRAVALGALLLSPIATVRAQTHVYHLNGTLADAMGGPSLGSDGGTLTDAGYAFGPNQGLTLANVFLSGALANSPYTIVLHYSLDDLDGFRKVIDFKNLSTGCVVNFLQTSGCGFYNGDWTHADQPFWYHDAYGAEGTYAPDVMATTVVERNEVGTIKVYVNGVAEFTDGDNAHQFGVFSGANNIARFFEDAEFAESGGFVDYIAVYDTALTQDQVAAIQETPVDATPEPASLMLLATGLIGIGGLARRKRRR